MTQSNSASRSRSAVNTSLHGRVVAAFGRQYEVVRLDAGDDTDNNRLTCYPRGKKSPYACGDEVDIAITADGQGVINALHPRQNLLWRSDAFRQKLIAANLDQIVIVVATEPGFSDLLISRCTVAAESERMQALIVLNKADLKSGLDKARARLAVFEQLGYPVLEVSALQDTSALRAHLAGKRSILVGQSGMGKSTLTNALIPEAGAATREISAALDSGKHTTTFARLYTLPESGWLIDSPGLQAFGLAHVDPEALVEHFPEFRPFNGGCRFRNCQHQAEPGCALNEALAQGLIDPRRFEHYRLIREEILQAHQARQGWR